MRVRALCAMATAAAALGVLTQSAAANPVNCAVNAPVGYVNCLNFADPVEASVRALHVSGRPYRFQLHRAATASTWGWWEYNDGNHHFIAANLSGTITAQVDNRGTGTPSVYEVGMV